MGLCFIPSSLPLSPPSPYGGSYNNRLEQKAPQNDKNNNKMHKHPHAANAKSGEHKRIEANHNKIVLSNRYEVPRLCIQSSVFASEPKEQPPTKNTHTQATPKDYSLFWNVGLLLCLRGRRTGFVSFFQCLLTWFVSVYLPFCPRHP